MSYHLQSHAVHLCQQWETPLWQCGQSAWLWFFCCTGEKPLQLQTSRQPHQLSCRQPGSEIMLHVSALLHLVLYLIWKVVNTDSGHTIQGYSLRAGSEKGGCQQDLVGHQFTKIVLHKSYRWSSIGLYMGFPSTLPQLGVIHNSWITKARLEVATDPIYFLYRDVPTVRVSFSGSSVLNRVDNFTFSCLKQGRPCKSSPFLPLRSHNFRWFRAPFFGMRENSNLCAIFSVLNMACLVQSWTG